MSTRKEREIGQNDNDIQHFADYEFVWIPFIIENWKHCSKIIFKWVNSTVGPNFKEKFVEICTCGSHEQCMGPTQKEVDADVICFQCNPNIY